MRLTKEERAARKTAFREMSLAGKADYIYAYYKLPVLLGLIALYLICSAVYRQMTKKRPSCTRPSSTSLWGMIWNRS